MDLNAVRTNRNAVYIELNASQRKFDAGHYLREQLQHLS